MATRFVLSGQTIAEIYVDHAIRDDNGTWIAVFWSHDSSLGRVLPSTTAPGECVRNWRALPFDVTYATREEAERVLAFRALQQ